MPAYLPLYGLSRRIKARVSEACVGYRTARALIPFLLLAQASPPALTSKPPANDEIVVTAKTQKEIDRLVEAVTQNEPGKQIARWNDAVCSQAIGVDKAHADYIAKRIGDVARRVKVGVGRTGCRPNVIIIFSDDADTFMAELVRRHPRLFGDPDQGMPSRLKREQVLRPAPVRWLAASQTRGPQGVPLAERVNPIYSASRLVRTTQENSAFLMVVVDSKGLHDLSWGQVSAYLAMVALARPDMADAFGPDTILSLFEQRDAGKVSPTDLTRYDIEILKALYSTNAGLGAEAQRSAIRSALSRASKPPGSEK